MGEELPVATFVTGIGDDEIDEGAGVSCDGKPKDPGDRLLIIIQAANSPTAIPKPTPKTMDLLEDCSFIHYSDHTGAQF